MQKKHDVRNSSMIEQFFTILEELQEKLDAQESDGHKSYVITRGTVNWCTPPQRRALVKLAGRYARITLVPLITMCGIAYESVTCDRG
jgi:hypothetical protein